MTPKKQSSSSIIRNVALCYVRQSWTRDANDTNSPERQKANILRLCQKNRWIPEWYEDAEGHKSGREENDRPNWLQLKARLASQDVAALVANDQSRIHPKAWRINQLIEENS